MLVKVVGVRERLQAQTIDKDKDKDKALYYRVRSSVDVEDVTKTPITIFTVNMIRAESSFSGETKCCCEVDT